MKPRVWLLPLLFCLVAVAVYLVGTHDLSCTSVAAAPPPLVVDKSSPLLLDDAPEPKKTEEEPFDPWGTPKAVKADNTACFVCHANFKEEPLAVRHAEANVGCMKCHGKSLEHRDDEDNITPPDKMYALDKIESNCKKCHDDHDVPAAKVIARWQKRCPDKNDPATIACTDCHGMHRLKIRTVRWNKNTGVLMAKKDEKEHDKPEGQARDGSGKEHQPESMM